MNQFFIRPFIRQYNTVKEFCREYNFEEKDLIFVSNVMYEMYFKKYLCNVMVVDYRKYGNREPTNIMVKGIYEEIKDYGYHRVIGIGGGTVLDVAKLFALEDVWPVSELFNGNVEVKKNKKLVLVPTTCGTGSEITNISILEFAEKNTKMGLANNQLFADDAVLIPELLEGLPFRFFATSSIDALIHAIESFTSPKANEFTKIFSRKAIKIILNVYKVIAEKGIDIYKNYCL